jgi:hypothetical protein
MCKEAGGVPRRCKRGSHAGEAAAKLAVQAFHARGLAKDAKWKDTRMGTMIVAMAATTKW